MAIGKKKMLPCEKCGTDTWATLLYRYTFKCNTCESEIDLIKAKRKQKSERKAARTMRAKEMGTYKSDATKKKERRSRRELDGDYIAWIKSLKCCVTGQSGVDAHHVIRKSQGGSDRTCVPLTHKMHMELHSIGVDTFENKYGVDLDALWKKLSEHYDSFISKSEGDKAPPPPFSYKAMMSR